MFCWFAEKTYEEKPLTCVRVICIVIYYRYNNCTTEAAYAKAHKNYLGPPCTKGDGEPMPRKADFAAEELAAIEAARASLRIS